MLRLVKETAPNDGSHGEQQVNRGGSDAAAVAQRSGASHSETNPLAQVISIDDFRRNRSKVSCSEVEATPGTKPIDGIGKFTRGRAQDLRLCKMAPATDPNAYQVRASLDNGVLEITILVPLQTTWFSGSGSGGDEQETA